MSTNEINKPLQTGMKALRYLSSSNENHLPKVMPIIFQGLREGGSFYISFLNVFVTMDIDNLQMKCMWSLNLILN